MNIGMNMIRVSNPDLLSQTCKQSIAGCHTLCGSEWSLKDYVSDFICKCTYCVLSLNEKSSS